MSAQLAENLGKVLNTNGEDQNSYESKKTAGQVDMMKNTLILAYQKCTPNCIGGLNSPLIKEVFGIDPKHLPVISFL